MHHLGCLVVDPQRFRIQPHTQHSRESAHLAPRARLSGNAPASPTPRRRVTQDHARRPPDPALAGPPAQHREPVAAMVTRRWHAIDSDEVLPPCIPHGANAPLASLLVHRASSGLPTVHGRNLRPVCAARRGHYRGTYIRGISAMARRQEVRGAVLRADADAICCMRVPRHESFRLLHRACAHGRRTIPTWACTPMPATHRDDDEHKQPGSEAVPCFASQSASGEPNVAEVRQKLKRVVWSITRQPCSRTRIELHMHRGRGFHAQCCVCSWMSFLCAHAGASQKRRTKRWVMQRSEVDRAVGCAVSKSSRAPKISVAEAPIAVARVRRHVRSIRTHWQACRQIVVNKEKSVPNITIPLIIVSNVDDALIAVITKTPRLWWPLTHFRRIEGENNFRRSNTDTNLHELTPRDDTPIVEELENRDGCEIWAYLGPNIRSAVRFSTGRGEELHTVNFRLLSRQIHDSRFVDEYISPRSGCSSSVVTQEDPGIYQHSFFYTSTENVKLLNFGAVLLR
ncbi:hypothetical protein B0H11DRAFT_1907728 [Mycena galericulata]|nr:hypothetical protein B0H11DRAFT_1907728 [Mycena galericulata]